MLPPSNLFLNQGLPNYHDNLLIVKVRPAARIFATTTATGDFLGAPGFMALATFERAGFIKSITPLSSATDTLPAAGAVATMASILETAQPNKKSGITLSGVSLIELEKGVDHKQVRLAMANDPYIESVSLVPVRYLMARPIVTPMPVTFAATPPDANTMWNLRKIKWREAISAGLNTNTDVHVAVLDTGIDLNHPDLPGSKITFIHSYPSGPSASGQDIVGHGTHVSGTICAISDNSVGINGICSCHLSVYKIFDDKTVYIPPPYGDQFSYVVDPILYRRALAACLDDGIQVINLSIGGYGEPDTVERDLFRDLIGNNVAVVAAMGNDNTSEKSYPAAIDDVIAVGATTINDTRAVFSNFGSHIALCAPGTSIWSTLPTYGGQTGFDRAPGSNPPTQGSPQVRDTDYAAWQGTSMATPHVTAAAALALAADPTLTPAQLKTKLKATVDKVPGMLGGAFTNFYGSGRLNLLLL